MMFHLFIPLKPLKFVHFTVCSYLVINHSALTRSRYPKFAAVFQRSLELWSHEPVISTTLLKLMTELTQNRSQRLLFDVMSPNGVLLFREISKTIMIYGKVTVSTFAE